MLSLPFQRPKQPVLAGQTVQLRPPVSGDFEEWSALRSASRAFLTPWEPTWAPDELERAAWRQRMRRYTQEMAQGSGVPFFVFEKAGGRLAGGISLGNVRHGVAQSAQIGYWMGAGYAGRGMMVEALNLVVDFGFRSLRLHRIEAACIPDNARSIRVLEKAGFRREGLLRSYLRINGVWRDHFLYALVIDDVEQKQERG